MKDDKKTDKKKILISCSLVVSCIVILLGSYLLIRSPKYVFIPSAREADTSHTKWTENTAPIPSAISPQESDNAGTEPIPGNSDDRTQTVINETEGKVVTDLSGSQTKEDTHTSKPKEPPVITEDNSNSDAPPVYNKTIPTPESTTFQSPSVSVPGETPPTSNSNDHAGQVYDPVFGWMNAEIPQGQVVDNDGDINKQVGSMN